MGTVVAMLPRRVNRCDPTEVSTLLIQWMFLKALDEVVENLYRTYFATYGNAFPLTEDRKLDRVLQETHRSRQMTNQIALRTFLGDGYDQGVLPTGKEAWQSMGIRIEGCLLTCEGAEACPTCKNDPTDYHGARYLTPFSPEYPHFEVLIQESGEKRLLGVGVVWEDHGCHVMPGWQYGCVGYHVDDGNIFDASNEIVKNEIEDAMAYRGDLIGCTVKFDLAAEEGRVLVEFYLNGKQITQGEISISTPKQGTTMNTSDGSNRANSCTVEGNSEEEQEMKMSALFGLDEMSENFQDNFRNVDKEIVDIHRELDLAGQEYLLLESQIFTQFNLITNLILHKRSATPIYLEMDSHGLTRRHLASPSELEPQSCDGVQLWNSELLIKIKEKVNRLGNNTSESFASVFEKLRDVKEDGKRHSHELNELRKHVKRKFKGLWDLIEVHTKCSDKNKEEK
ncbi:hypothetical protein OS493_024596 [Desmophyllum pertusum]|uniref:Uncharacterized protein n=1 Tax=Desmophyllum pertusum TaxID=174260 RepID=A0A9W9ZZ61_9CNID|nr:hypothetical protein OS493_024596 [Desmophyllum pertusum]